MTTYEPQFLITNDDSSSSATESIVSRGKVLNQIGVAKQLRKLAVGNEFMSDFDPETSTRERRKLSRKCYAQGPAKKYVYDEKGRYRSNGADACDCLDALCPGCHFPCPNCKSPKCGTQCRVHRKWAFEVVEHDGKDLVLTNRNIETT